MSSAITKTISLLLLIFIGYLFQRKLKNKDQLDGIKTLILSLALPATIFIALLQIDFESDLIIIPILSIAFNLLVYVLVDRLPLRQVFNIPKSQHRALVMLIPSLAPGLSCFPFIMEYSGQSALAMAALADVGNKVFVLIISYTIAMRWYYEVNDHVTADRKSKIKDLLYSLMSEPVNLVIVAAVIALSFGVSYAQFPDVMTLSVDRLSIMMTPLILLFIGLSMRLTWGQVKTIFSFLFFRSGIAFLISYAVLMIIPVSDLSTILLIVVFPQSACSFWPYAHMSAVAKMESKSNVFRGHTFDLGFAMNVLACSMPFSVVLIMTVYASGAVFASSSVVLAAALIFIAVGVAIAVAASRQVALMKTQAVDTSTEETRERPASSHA